MKALVCHALTGIDGLKLEQDWPEPALGKGLVLIDVQVPRRLDPQVDHRVLGEQFEHVVEESHARRQVAFPRTIEVERQADRGFPGGSLDRGGARHGGFETTGKGRP